MKRTVGFLWMVVGLLVSVNMALVLMNHVSTGSIWDMSIKYIEWILVLIASFMVVLSRTCANLFETEEETIERRLYRNMLEQPSDLDSLGHRTTKGGK